MLFLQDHFQMSHGHLEFNIQVSPFLPLGLVGPNGIGKTTLFQFFKIHQHELFSSLRLGFLDQEPLSPLGHLKGMDLFEMLQAKFPQRTLFSSWKAYPLVEEFSFGPKMRLPIQNLSGGENQILKLLALFYLKTDFYFLDEPSNHLDEGRRNLLKRFLKKLVTPPHESELGLYMLIIDHQKEFLREICQQFVCFERKDPSSDSYIARNRDEGLL